MLKNPGTAAPPRWLRTAAWGARVALWLVLAAWGLFALTWGVLHWVIVPRVGEWRPALETAATRALGVRVQVAGVQALSSGPIPAFELRDVRLFDGAGREALHLPRVRSALSVRSLWRLGFEQLLIEGPVLDVRRTAAGRIEIGGIDVSADPDGDSARAADWFFSQTEFVVRGGELRWTDDTRPGHPPLVLGQIDAVVRNPGRQHHWRLDATPPTEWGARFSLRGHFASPLWPSRPGAWRDWSGTAYAEAPWLDLQHLRHHLDLAAWTGAEVRQGRGAVRAWATAERGVLTEFSTDLALPSVALHWPHTDAPLALQALSGRLTLQHQGPRTRLDTRALTFTTADGLVWPGSDLSYTQTRAADGAVRQWDVQADRVDLALLAPLVAQLPVPAEWPATLAELRPAGQAQALSLGWTAPDRAGAPEHWRGAGRVQGLALQAAAALPPVVEADGALAHPLGRPGLSGADVEFAFNQDGGRGRLTLQDGSLTFPGLFEEATLPFQRFSTDAVWRHDRDRLEVDLAQLSFQNADAQGQGRVQWRTADPATSTARSRFPGVIDLDVRMDRADGARVHRYLPQDIPDSVRRYLREAVRTARAQDVRFQVQGDLWDFPFPDPLQGKFEVRARLQDVDLAYVPEHLRVPGDAAWPALERVQADLHIDRVALDIRNASGGVQGGGPLRAVQTMARIADFTADEPLLEVRGTVQGPGEQALAFVNRSPLGGLIGGVLDQARLGGTVDVGLGLALPLNHPEAVKVTGQLKLGGNDLRVTPGSPWLQAAKGTLEFSEQGFRLPQASARLLGGELRFSGAMERRGERSVVHFQGQGLATAEGLRRAGDMGAEWAALAQLGQHSSGGTPYRARLEFLPEGANVLVESGLQGLALNLPAPLDKTGPALLPLRYEVTALPVAPAELAAGVTRDRLVLELGAGAVPVLSAQYEREHAVAGTQVLRGAVAVR
uniref:YhdP family phospholipid transporter n=1 Tax=Macromonas nakdongensis TaxID=1843082 RepID=UPI003F6E493B